MNNIAQQSQEFYSLEGLALQRRPFLMKLGDVFAQYSFLVCNISVFLLFLPNLCILFSHHVVDSVSAKKTLLLRVSMISFLFFLSISLIYQCFTLLFLPSLSFWFSSSSSKIYQQEFEDSQSGVEGGGVDEESQAIFEKCHPTLETPSLASFNPSSTTNSFFYTFPSVNCFFEDLLPVLLLSCGLLLLLILFFFPLSSSPSNCVQSVWYIFVFKPCDSPVSPIILFLLVLSPSLFMILTKGKFPKISCFIILTSCLSLLLKVSDIPTGILVILLSIFINFITILDKFYFPLMEQENIQRKEFLLKENYDRLEKERTKQMKDLIGNVAHDLKTPLASFMQGIELIQDSLVDLESKLISPSGKSNSMFSEFYSQISQMRNTNSFMLMTIHRCIDYTKASNGLKLTSKPETIDWREVILLPLNCMKSIQSHLEIELVPILEDLSNYIITDKQWLQENIFCLLSNAVKYSSEGKVTVSVSLQKHSEAQRKLSKSNPHSSSQTSLPGTVPSSESTELTTQKKFQLVPGFKYFGWMDSNSPDGLINEDKTEEFSTSRSPNRYDYLLFEVEDTGIGMSEEAMKQLFNPFAQAQRLAGGTGLGLYSLSKRIEALGGFYGVNKRKDGKRGSLFWFSIPYRPDSTIRQHLGNNSSETKKINALPRNSFLPRFKYDSNFALSSETVDDCEVIELPPNDQKKVLNVLLVEDSPTVAKLTSLMLKKLGMKVSVAENGARGLGKMIEIQEAAIQNNDKSNLFDVVLMDFQMPVMDGLEATKRYREFEKKQIELGISISHLPIIGLSATLDEEMITEGIKLGLDDYLFKPLTAESFFKKIKGLEIV